MATQQETLWKGFVKDAKEHIGYVGLSDKKKHSVVFQEDTPRVSVGEYGQEMVIKVIEHKNIRLLTISKALARELEKEITATDNVELDKLKDHEFSITRQGAGYTTFYEVDYEMYLGD